MIAPLKLYLNSFNMFMSWFSHKRPDFLTMLPYLAALEKKQTKRWSSWNQAGGGLHIQCGGCQLAAQKAFKKEMSWCRDHLKLSPSATKKELSHWTFMQTENEKLLKKVSFVLFHNTIVISSCWIHLSALAKHLISPVFKIFRHKTCLWLLYWHWASVTLKAY